MDRILLVEDDDSLREVLGSILENEGFEVHPSANVDAAEAALKAGHFSLVLSDFRLPHRDGLDLLHVVRELHPNLPFLLMTAFGSIEIATEAMKLGANDFICKPFEPQTICKTVKEVIQHRRVLDRTLGLRSRREHPFLTQNPAMQHVLGQARKVARVDSTVLILGESGTGKELVARYIHEHSSRKDRPFVAVNCAAMPPELLESEFFGHEAGAFTGATQDRKGVFEMSSEGTLFLDEIGDMAPALQVKLLRALQDKEIKPVGGTDSIKVNPRIIAATNQPIEEALKTHRLREDFYYRLAVVTLNIPPLRGRPDDVTLLVQYFMEYFCNAAGKQLIQMDATAWDLLKRYPWPGNTRELENVIERAVILAQDKIFPEHLGIQLGLSIEALEEATLTLPEIALRASQQAEIEIIRKVLLKTRGNKTQAAKLLGVSYKTLLNKVKEYKLGADAADEGEEKKAESLA